MDVDIIKNTIDTCNARWNSPNDTKTDYFERVLPCFLDEFEGDEKDLLLALINEFVYYSHSKVNKCLVELYDKLMQDKNFSINTTVFCVLKSKSGRINSSVEYLNEFVILNGISKYIVYPNIEDAIDYLHVIDNVVLIDDYCGSGETLRNFVKKYLELLKNKTVFYIVVHIMEEAITRINDYSNECGIRIRIISIFQSQKAFLNKSEDKTKFKEASIKAGIIDGDDIWGFKRTEALVSYYNDTPNNTLGVFWKETDKNKPLFPRKNDERPVWLKMKHNRKRRDGNNYILEVKNNAR